MNQNPYKTPIDSSLIESGEASFSLKRFLVRNAVWIIVLAAGTYVMSQYHFHQSQKQLPRLYASYDHEISIDIYPTILAIVIMIGLPNVLAYLFGVYSGIRSSG